MVRRQEANHQICLTRHRIVEHPNRVNRLLRVEIEASLLSCLTVSERSSSSRVRFAAPNNGTPFTTPGRSEKHFSIRDEGFLLNAYRSRDHHAAIMTPFVAATDTPLTDWWSGGRPATPQQAGYSQDATRARLCAGRDCVTIDRFVRRQGRCSFSATGHGIALKLSMKSGSHPTAEYQAGGWGGPEDPSVQLTIANRVDGIFLAFTGRTPAPRATRALARADS